METDVYKTPEADLQNDNQVNPDYYVVAPKKFVVLFVATFGVYSLYWFYKNWQLYRLRTEKNIWPVMRAIFSIFYVHSLFEIIDSKLKDTNSSFKWSYRPLANIYILCTIIQNVCDRLSSRDIGSPITDIASLTTLPIIGYSIYIGQKAINTACNMPYGEINSKYTAANIFWIISGSILWLLAMTGYINTIFGIPGLE